MSASSVRMMMQEQYMMSGECPSEKELSTRINRLHAEIEISNVKQGAQETRYAFTEGRTGNSLQLPCANNGIRVIN
jgi:hypothetical protein